MLPDALRGNVGSGGVALLLLLRRELDAFREGHYVPIINEHC